jgi:SNF2 family DNA or RNA helicase
MPNSPADLVPQFTFLYPEVAVTEESVIERFRPVFVRTRKSELGLAPPHRVLVPVDLKPSHRALYDVLTQEAARQLSVTRAVDRISFRRVARCVQHLIQAASNPALLSNTDLTGQPLLRAAVEEPSAKLEMACILARRLVSEEHKVLIWSTFVQTVEHLAGLMGDLGARFIHGDTPTSEDGDQDSREQIIRSFNDPDSPCRVLVANPAACSEGISLHHVCRRAIYVDRNYNAAQYLQSEDRIHRIGLPPDTNVSVFLLTSPGTIDVSVGRRLEAKVATMGTALDDPGLSIKPFSLEEDDELLGLNSEDLDDLRKLIGLGT